MSDAETVALWLGIVVGIVSVTLSVVAIAFTWMVNRRAEQVNDQTVKSLQMIETTVSRLSEDTSGLIKAAWDKLLGQVGPPPETQESRENAEQIASGLATEMQSALTPESETGSDALEEVKRRIEDIRSTLVSQMASLRPQSPGDRVQSLLSTLNGLSNEARALTRAIEHRHLTRGEYQAIRRSNLRQALLEIRRAGLLVPLTGLDSSGQQISVYYYPPGDSRAVRAALQLLPDEPMESQATVKEELAQIGYKPT